ncbi:PLP-dependent aminotransferase family protein [Hoeflea sp. TYP-13]|uniref:PLP-dependent aminotransferase family protein n=1 Tax=Hoeflea sp. TYP-13 TaxID=3230023 RepID=UPI0034C5ECD0
MDHSVTKPEYDHAGAQQIGKKDFVRRAICLRIVEGIYRKGEKVPSCREIAEQLQVSKNSAYQAYSGLVDLGILESRNRSGFTVGLNVPDVKIAEQIGHQPEQGLSDKLVFASNLPDVNMRANQPRNWAEFEYPFVYNQIDSELFPIEAWRECSRLALGRNALPIWTSEAVDVDCPDLIFQLRRRLLHYRGIKAAEDEILVTVGAQHALCIISTLFAEDRRPIAFENPGYQEARHLFHLYGNEIQPVPVDAHGMVPDELPAEFKLLYLTPGCQFPTMVSMPEDRREQVLRKAEAAKAFIIEDDYEVGLLGHVKPSPALKSRDRSGTVIYVGSLSKTLSPSIRMGFIVAHRDIIEAAKTIRSLTVRHPPSIVQETAALFLAHGYHDVHLKKLREIYSQRWHIMRDGIVELLPMFSLGHATGGTSFWLTGPAGFDAHAFAERLQTRGVLIEPGHIFYHNGYPKNSFRIGFPSVATDKIRLGLRHIGEEARSFLKKSKHAGG